MIRKHQTELVRHRMYVAGVDVEPVYMDDAMRLDEAEDALRRGDAMRFPESSWKRASLPVILESVSKKIML